MKTTSPLGSLAALCLASLLCMGCSSSTGDTYPLPATGTTEFSGTYYTNFISSPRYTLDVTRRGTTVRGTMSGGGMVFTGRGTMSGDVATLTVTTPVAMTMTLQFTTAPSGTVTFSGTWTAGPPVSGDGSITGSTLPWPTHDLATGIPQFVTADFTDLSTTNYMTYLRSSAGHDYVDDFETCRSMKHCYESLLPGSSIPVFSPVTGTVVGVSSESGPGGGVQLGIQDPAHPAFTFILFHVNSATPYAPGDPVTAGQSLGTVGGDIAVGVNTPTGFRLVSFLETMTPAVFATYQARGVATPQTLILTAAQRDADPLTCSGETFTSTGTLPVRLLLN